MEQQAGLPESAGPVLQVPRARLHSPQHRPDPERAVRLQQVVRLLGASDPGHGLCPALTSIVLFISVSVFH